jgi:methylmalonyl-CoA mutase N-terminal domain/subunit
MDKVAELGGSVQALEFIQREIEESAASYHERYRSGQDIVVGVNKFVTETMDEVDILRVDPASETAQLERLKKFKENRDTDALAKGLADLKAAAEGSGNLLPPIKDALRANASIGEVCNTMRDVFGEYKGGAFF